MKIARVTFRDKKAKAAFVAAYNQRVSGGERGFFKEYPSASATSELGTPDSDGSFYVQGTDTTERMADVAMCVSGARVEVMEEKL